MKQLLFPILVTLILSCKEGNLKAVDFPEGGYQYPVQIDSSDKLTYIYPLKDLLPRKDSFSISYYFYFLFKSFNEPNLSITPTEQPVFRLIYQPGFSRYTAILTIQEDKIIVKELETGYAMPYKNEEQLDSLEKKHLWLFESFFPIDEYKGNKYRKLYLDSIINIYPQLLSVDYYKQLMMKASSFGSEAFTYKAREIPITKRKYRYFVNLINQSGYWKMKPLNKDCPGMTTHPSGYILEAATQRRYNYVSFISCTNSSQLEEVCNELISYSKVAENERNWHKELQKKIK
jgi:hypothetical protein